MATFDTSYVGIYAENADEIELRNNFERYIHEVIVLSESNATFFNMSTADLNLGNNPAIIRWFWNKLFNQLPTKNRLRITGKSYAYSLNEAAATTSNLVSTFNLNRYSNETPYAIRVVFIRRGMDVFEHMTKAFVDYTRYQGVETTLTKDRYHKLRIYKDTANTIVYVTNRWEGTDIYKLLGLLPVFYTDILANPTDADAEAYKICDAFYNSNMNTILDIIREECKEIQEQRYTRMLESLRTNVTRIAYGNTAALEQSIHTQTTLVNQTTSALATQQVKLHDLKTQLLTRQLLPTEIDDGTIEFLAKTKAIKLVDCDTNHATWEIFTPIANYNKKDVEMYFKRPEANSLNSPGWFGALIQETFIEEKYQLMTHTKLGMSWTSPDSWINYYDEHGRFGNPHITNYNCYGTTKAAVNEALLNGNLLHALNMIIAACATITFTDGHVTNKLSNALRSYALEYKILRNVETNELISPKNFKDTFEGRQTNEANNAN